MSRSARLILTTLVFGILALGAQNVSAQGNDKPETPNVRIKLDWLYDGVHSFILAADERGYFRDEGLTVQIDAGTGSGVAVQNVASGQYEFAIADFPTMVQFVSQNPDKALTAIYMVMDKTPLGIMSLKSKGINTPADLDGKRITGRPGMAAHDLAPILLKRANAEKVRINWQNVSGQIEGSMFVRGGLDGMAGFSFTQAVAVAELGIPDSDINLMRFSDFGVDLYGLAFIASKSFVEKNPNTTRAFLRAVNRALKDALRDPDATIELLRKREPLVNARMERRRLLVGKDLIVTDNVLRDGLGMASQSRLQNNIDTIDEMQKAKKKPAIADVYTDKFLPVASERKVAR